MRWPVTPEGRRSSGDQERRRTDDRLDAWLADEYGLAGSLSPLGGRRHEFPPHIIHVPPVRRETGGCRRDARGHRARTRGDRSRACGSVAPGRGSATVRQDARRRDCIRTPGCRRRLAAPVGPRMGAGHPVAGVPVSDPRRNCAALDSSSRRSTARWPGSNIPQPVGRTIGISRGPSSTGRSSRHVDRRHALVDWAFQLYAAYVRSRDVGAPALADPRRRERRERARRPRTGHGTHRLRRLSAESDGLRPCDRAHLRLAGAAGSASAPARRSSARTTRCVPSRPTSFG